MKKMGKDQQVSKPTAVSTSSSIALEALRKQTGKSKSLRLKSFLFSSFQSVGHCVSIISGHYCPICSTTLMGPVSFLPFVWSADFYFCAYARIPLFCHFRQSMAIISFKNSIKSLFFRRCGEKSMVPGDEELVFNPGSATHWLCELGQVN